MWDWIVRHKQGNGNRHMHVGGKKKKHIALSSFILLPTNIFDSASVVATVMMVPHLKRRKEEGSGSVVSLFPCRKTSTST